MVTTGDHHDLRNNPHYKKKHEKSHDLLFSSWLNHVKPLKKKKKHNMTPHESRLIHVKPTRIPAVFPIKAPLQTEAPSAGHPWVKA